MEKFKNILVTGGAGFIGGALIRKIISLYDCNILNIDKFGYASDLSGINLIESAEKLHRHLRLDLINKNELENVFEKFKPNLVIHLAAESHVDRSINNPYSFIESNIIGTFNLIETSCKYWESLDSKNKSIFKFHHVSTDEVYGTLPKNSFFNENSRYSPRSPYSASKAASDHIVMSWYHTYGLPVVITNCSNNYGPYQFPEKLIPLTILKALSGEEIPIYGDGSNQRDWLFVEDHIDAILKSINSSKTGLTYCIGGNSVKTNLQTVESICTILDNLKPSQKPYKELISFVKDRPGHDKRYAIDTSKIKSELNWEPNYSFENGLEITINWYLKNLDWCRNMIKNSGYKGDRLGLKG